MTQSPLRHFIQTYQRLFDKLINSENSKILEENELTLLGYILSPILFSASVVSIIVGIIWNYSLLEIFMSFLVLFISSQIVQLIYKMHLGSKLKLHLISFVTIICLADGYLIYYDNITFLFWFMLVTVSLLAIINTNKIYILYVTCFYIIAYFYTLIFKYYDNIHLDKTFYGILLFMIVLVQTVSIIMNRFYTRLISGKLTQYATLATKKEEVTALYEEIVATEEELREQNIVLSNYTLEIESNQKRLEYLAYNDTLTGLPNRKYFMEQLDILLDISTDESHSFAVVFIDLDHFKRVNDSLGHSAGDILLIQVATRLMEKIDTKDILGRIGGDELAMLIRRKISDEQLLSYLENLVKLFNEPFQIDHVATKVTASFGISMWPQDGLNAEDLLKAADVAMYKAKDLGRNTIQFYRNDMKNEVLSKIQLENRLINAIVNNELYLVYQPIFNPQTHTIESFEALLRWELPDHGPISPAVFIPFAEDIGLINRLGEWVIEQACIKIQEINATMNRKYTIAINVSAVQMKDKDFVAKIKRIINKTQVLPSCMEFEITESVFIHNMEQAVHVLKSIKDLGINIAMDDFGTGYSSLSYLMKLPIDKLKIDKSFIDEIQKSDQKNNLIKSIISMAHSLDLTVVAEGVETELQLSYLQQQQCNLVQGYLLSRPLMDEAVVDFIKNHIRQ